jgi:peptide/nickel transport system substrate-binding protein
MRRLVLVVVTAGLLIASTGTASAASGNTVLAAGLRSSTVHGAATLTELADGAAASLAVKLYDVKPATTVTLVLYGGPNGTGPLLAGRDTFRSPAAGPATHSFALTRAEFDLLRAAIARGAGLSVVATATPAHGSGVRLVGTFPTPAAPNVDSVAFGTSYAPVAGTSGGTIVMGDWQAADQLNPYYATSYVDTEASLPLLRGCATISSDGKYIPDLCASLPSESNGGLAVSGGGMTLTLHLKPNLRWSDGQPLTMNDLKYTWQWANDPNQSGCTSCGPGTAWPLIDSIDVSSDGLTATVHFKQLFGGWLSWLTSAILPAHYMSTIPVAQAAAQSYPASSAVVNAPVSGPFVVKGISASEIDYVPNPDFAAGVSPAHQGPAYLDALTFRFFPDPTSEIAAFEAGSIDLALGLGSYAYAALAGTPASVGSVQPSPAWEYEHLDLNNDPGHARGNGFWSVGVREAIAMAINRAAIVAADFPGQHVTLACSPTPPNTWYATNEACPRYQPAAAVQLLAKNGWKVDRHGWVANAAGHEMNLELATTAGNPTRLAELRIVQSNLRAIHVKSYIKTGDAGSAFFGGWTTTTPTTDPSIYRGNYDIADFAYVMSGSPYGDYFVSYDSTQWPQLGDHSGANDTRFASPQMDTALAELKTDVALGAQLYDAYAVQDAHAAGIPEIPLYYDSTITGVGVHLGNWPGYNPSSQGPTWNVEDWYVKP